MVVAQSDVAALAGIRVLDLTDNYSAYAGRLLADLGADVVRLEPPAGSPVRTLAPSERTTTGECVSFAHEFLDAGKRAAAELVEQMIEPEDIVVEELAVSRQACNELIK